MEVIRFSEDNKQDYINFVTAQGGSFLQSWSWGEFQTAQGRPAIRYGVLDNEKIVGAVQLLKTKVPHMKGFYLYAPYGPVGEIDLAQIKKDFPDCWFIRLEPQQEIKIHGVPTQRIQPGKTLLIDLQLSEEELQNQMHPKTRYNIKVAAKHNVTIATTAAATPEVIALLVETSGRQNYHSYPGSYYEALIGSVTGDAKVVIYQANYNKQLLAAAIMIDCGATRTYLFGGSTDEYRNVMAPYALHWQAILDAKTKGIKFYDWWGIETATGQTPGFVQFKLKWGGQPIHYPPAIDIPQHRAWYNVYKVFRKLNRLFLK